MSNRDTTTIYYKIYYTHDGKQSFNWTEDRLMVRPMVEAIKEYGYQFDYVAQVVTKTTVREHRLEVLL